MSDDNGAERRDSRAGRRESDVTNAAAARARSRLVIRPGENWYRDVFLLIALALLVVAVTVAHGATRQADRADHRAVNAIAKVQAGRASASSIICAATDAMIAAGEHVITGANQAPETPFDRALERLGYPPRHNRIAASNQAAVLYAQAIDSRIKLELNRLGVRTPRRLMRPDGTVDCRVMLHLANVPERFVH